MTERAQRERGHVCVSFHKNESFFCKRKGDLLSVPMSLCYDISIFLQVYTKVNVRIRVRVGLGYVECIKVTCFGPSEHSDVRT